jgi:hypothetical protein
MPGGFSRRRLFITASTSEFFITFLPYFQDLPPPQPQSRDEIFAHRLTTLRLKRLRSTGASLSSQNSMELKMHVQSQLLVCYRRMTSPLLVGAATLALSAGIGSAHAASAAIVYSNDFQTSSLAGITTGGSLETAPDGSSEYLQLVNGQTAVLSLSGGYSSYSVSYDVYAINTVDGDGPAGGNSPQNPDSFSVATNTGAMLEDYSFANYPGNTQNYPVSGSPAQSGAAATGQLGYASGSEATYSFTEAFGPSTGPTQLVFTGNTNQSTDDESFGVDNIVVTGAPILTSGVPEPGVWVMMLAGVAMMGASLRLGRKRGAAALAA